MPTRPDAEDPADLDEELDLPPTDADGEEDAASSDGAEDLPADAEEGGLDDAESEDLDVGGDDLDENDEGDDEGDEIDVGDLDEGMLIDEEALEGAEAERAAEDYGLGGDEAEGADDGGAEGTDEDPGDEVDEAALPEMDDDDGEAEDDGLAAVLLAEGEAAIPWAAARWTPLEGAGAAVPCRAVAAAGGRVAVAGEVLLLIEEGALTPRPLPSGEGAVAVALGDDALLAATARGQLLVSRDGGAEAAALGSWRAGVEASLGLWPADAGSAVALAATPGRFWIRAGAALLCATAPARPLAAVRERGVLAITASAGVLVALTAGAEGPALERFRSDDEGWAETRLGADVRGLCERDRGALRLAAAAGGKAVALSDQQRLAVSRDGGATFRLLDVGATPAVAFAGDDLDAPLLALVAGKGGAAFLLEIDAGGEAARIAEIAGAAGPAALAWDAAREVVWVASAAGLTALGRPRRH
jgi:hypothetical protein